MSTLLNVEKKLVNDVFWAMQARGLRDFVEALLVVLHLRKLKRKKDLEDVSKYKGKLFATLNAKHKRNNTNLAVPPVKLLLDFARLCNFLVVLSGQLAHFLLDALLHLIVICARVCACG